MALAGTGQAAAAAVTAAEEAVKAAWLAKNRVLSEAEQAQMLEEVRAAGLNALFAHIVGAAVLVVPALGLTAPSGGGPVVGAAGGSIT